MVPLRAPVLPRASARGHPRGRELGGNQPLSPSRRLAHQPRLGCGFSSDEESEITGAGEGAGWGGKVGEGVTPIDPEEAGSRTVERRRGASASETSGAADGDGNSASAVGGVMAACAGSGNDDASGISRRSGS